MSDGQDDDRHAPIAGHVLMGPKQPQEQRAGNQAEEAEVHNVAEIGTVRLSRGGVGTYGLQNRKRLRAHEQTFLRSTADVANGCSQHVVTIHAVRVWVLQIFRYADRIVQRDHRCGVGIVRQKNGREILVLGTRPVKGSAQGIAVAHL